MDKWRTKKINLSIVPISNWDRNNWYDEKNYIWKNPKPYINDLKTLLAYNGMDLFRGTNLNLGFGTKKALFSYWSTLA